MADETGRNRSDTALSGTPHGSPAPWPGSPLARAAERVAARVLAEDRVWGNYTLDLALEALLTLAEAAGRADYRDYVLGVVARRGWTPAADIRYETQPFCSLTYAVSRATGNPAWLGVFGAQSDRWRREAARSPEGAVLHPRGEARGGGWALLIDGMQEYAVRMARAGEATGDGSYFEECARQVRLHRAILRDPRTGLWSQGRGWLAAAPAALSPGAWSRGHGWLLRGLAGALAHLPRTSAEFAEVKDVLRETADALLAVQASGGMWHCLLHRPAAESSPETSGTAMIAWYLAQSCAAGWLSPAPYGEAAQRALASLAGQVSDDGTVRNVSPGPGPLEDEEPYLRTPFPAGNEHGAFAILQAAAGQRMLAAECTAWYGSVPYPPLVAENDDGR